MIEGSLRLFGYGLGLFLFGEGRERRTSEGEDIGSGKDFVVVIQLGFREMAKSIAAGPELACGSDS